MKKLQVLGTGCPKCGKLTEAVEDVARGLGIEYRIEKVTDIAEIMEFGVMMTPALVVDGTVKSSGRIPTRNELKEMIGA